MDKKSYDNGTDFSFVEQKVREVQTTIENAVKTSNYQELNQSITKMVNNTETISERASCDGSEKN